MTVIEKLASSLERNDEGPNIELAEQISNNNDELAVKELIELLSSKNKVIQNDCIKVLYEIGERTPSLVSNYSKEFITLLESKNNRLQWGAMTALNTITFNVPEVIYLALPKILSAAEKGSVITKDYAVAILIKLCTLKEYHNYAFSFLIEQLIKSPTNQLPMYAERALPIITSENKQLFIDALRLRLNDIEKETKRKRVEKVLKKCEVL